MVLVAYVRPVFGEMGRVLPLYRGRGEVATTTTIIRRKLEDFYCRVPIVEQFKVHNIYPNRPSEMPPRVASGVKNSRTLAIGTVLITTTRDTAVGHSLTQAGGVFLFSSFSLLDTINPRTLRSSRRCPGVGAKIGSG